MSNSKRITNKQTAKTTTRKERSMTHVVLLEPGSVLTSPYNFIELNSKVFPAYDTESELPDRNAVIPYLISGEIDYSVDVKTPVVFENELTKLSASTIRGLVKNNLQILGYASLASDIEDDTYKFRSVAAGFNRGTYRDIMGATQVKSTRSTGSYTEYKNIRAGVLFSDSNGYYIVRSDAFRSKGFYKLNIRKIQRENADWRDRFNVSWNSIKNIFDTLPNTSSSVGIHRHFILEGKNLRTPFFKKVSWDGTESAVHAVGEEGQYPHNAYILNSGYSFGNVSLYLIPTDFDSTTGYRYPISKYALRNYIHHISKNPDINKNPYYNLPHMGEQKPVFFVINNGYCEFGFTMLFPISYKHSVGDGIPSAHKQGIIDYDKALFGFKNVSGYYSGRVAFLQPQLANPPMTSLIKETLLLPSAKPNSTTCYLTDDNDAGYNSDHFELRGTKQYWLKKEVLQTPAPPSSKICTIVSGYKEGTQFHGKILFYNLREDELGLLLWSVGLNEESQQNIGAGKQYGYGRVKIKVDRVFSRNNFDQYASEDLREWGESGMLLDPEYYIRSYQKLLDSFLDGNLKSDNRLQGFFEMKNANLIPDASKTSYAELRKFRQRYIFPSIKDIINSQEWLIIPEKALKAHTSISWDTFYKNPPESIRASYPEGQLIESYQSLTDLLELFRNNRKYVIRTELIQEYLELNTSIKNLLSAYNSKRAWKFVFEYDQYMDKLIKEIDGLILKLDTNKERFILSSVPHLTEASSSSIYSKSKKELNVNLDISLDAESIPIKVLRVYGIINDTKVCESNQTYYVDGGSTFSVDLVLPVTEEDVKNQYVTYKFCMEYEARINSKRQKLLYENISESPILDREFSVLVNPYSRWLGNEVSDKNMFFGRDKLLETIMEKINCCSEENVSGRNIIIYGQKRTGKSTVLHFVNKKLEAIPERYVVANIGNTASIFGYDNKNPDARNTINLKYFFAKMVSSVKSSLVLNHKSLFNDLLDEGFLFPKLNRMTEADAMAECSNFFERLVNRLAPDKRLVILIDEFTYFYDLIIKHQMNESFMRFWKAFIQNTKICAVLIGQDFMDDFRNAYPNEFGASDFIRINYLDKISTEQLIRKPFERENGYEGFSSAAVERIYNLTSGNAFFTMNLCSELVSYLNEAKSTRVITDFSINRFLKTHWFNPNSNKRLDKAFFDSLYNDGNHREWDDDNLQLLYSVAEHCYDEGFANKEVLLAEYDDNPDTIDNARLVIPFCKEKLEQLIYRDVLIEVKEKLYVKVQLFAEWLLARYSN